MEVHLVAGDGRACWALLRAPVELSPCLGIELGSMAATGFGENQPVDPANTPEAFAKNRRIEIRLTDR